MNRPGFIQDELELKLLILYICARVSQPIPYETLWDLTLCDTAIDYFEFTERLSDLVRTQHLIIDEDDLYAITEKGIRNSKICETTLPYSVRIRCDKNVKICNRRLSLEQQVKASHAPRDNGTFTVSLNLTDDMGSVMEINAMVVTEDMAKDLEKRFLENPQQLYQKMMTVLLTPPEEAPPEDQVSPEDTAPAQDAETT